MSNKIQDRVVALMAEEMPTAPWGLEGHLWADRMAKRMLREMPDEELRATLALALTGYVLECLRDAVVLRRCSEPSAFLDRVRKVIEDERG